MKQKDKTELINALAKEFNSALSPITLVEVLELLEVKFTEFGIIDLNEAPAFQFQWNEVCGGGEVELRTHWDATIFEALGYGEIVRSIG